MEDKLKKLARVVSDTGSPVDLSMEGIELSLDDGRKVEVEGSLSISPAEAEEGEGSVEELEEAVSEVPDFDLESGGMRLHCSEKETCVLELQDDDLTMNVVRASIFKELVKGVGGGGGSSLESVKEKGYNLHVKYKGMTLVKNADPDSISKFMDKI